MAAYISQYIMSRTQTCMLALIVTVDMSLPSTLVLPRLWVWTLWSQLVRYWVPQQWSCGTLTTVLVKPQGVRKWTVTWAVAMKLRRH